MRISKDYRRRFTVTKKGGEGNPFNSCMALCSPAVLVRMRSSIIFFFFFFGVFSVYPIQQVHGQSHEGFISIDCGAADGSVYNANGNGATTLDYSPDAPYIDTGESVNVSAAGQLPQFRNCRRFPNGTRNCYRLRPVKPGGKYLVRAGFWYGNYTRRNNLPEFDLHIGVNFWSTVRFKSDVAPRYVEIIAVALADTVWVCLVNTGKGTPFVSTLELRPLPTSLYVAANPAQALVLIQDRTNYGSNTSWLRYPDDPYDRIWNGYQEGVATMISAAGKLMAQSKAGDGFEVPSTVLSTAFTVSAESSYYISQGPVLGSSGDGVYVAMHFAEIQQLLPNETRKMNIFEGDSFDAPLLYVNYSPPFLVADARIAKGSIGSDGTYTLPSIQAAPSSTRGPMINALEVFALKKMDGLSTDSRDVDAMEDIKREYQVKRNWNGDPCAPEGFVWEGVNCSYEASKPPRITSLNLSSSGLNNGITASIANLTALTTLDLSNNNLAGTVPNFLAELASLKLLNLAGNKLTGTIPRDLCRKVQSAALSLSIQGNPEPCSEVTKKKKTFIFVIVVASVIFLVLLGITIFLWRTKWRRQFGASNEMEDFTQKTSKDDDGLKRESQCFTFSEIINITRNFETKIGRGGFGTVYLGYLHDGTEVAVKVLAQSSSQGRKEFQMEVVLLTRVHHRNLVSLLGYCDEECNLALVYEYMDQGNLRDHLSGKINNVDVLSWEQRIKIVLQAAQGLDYLHNGCKPSIIHRDVKSTNILLNHNFVAKVSDFGLSRAFDNEKLTHVSTLVVGTIGYLDPEYHETYQLNEKSDVYSFGVTLLETITGQSPILHSLESTHIVKWVHSRIRCGDITSIVDSRLCGHYDINSVWKVLEIAMACTSATTSKRLSMSEVVTLLKECLVPAVGDDVLTSLDAPSLDSFDTYSLGPL